MPGSVNKAILIGNLGADPEVRSVGDTQVANFSLATNESYKDKNGQKVEKAEWHRIVMWRKLAEVAGKYLKKGATVYIEGKITTRSWEDEAGVKKYTTEVVAHNMQMLGGKSAGSGDPGPSEPPGGGWDGPRTTPADPEDDLAF